MKTTTKNPHKTLSYVNGLMARGRYTFTTKDAVSSIKAGTIAVRASLRRLRQKGVIATPIRGFHVIVPPEYSSLSCLPPEQFIPAMMEWLGEPYYAGLLTAAELHGAAHQKPQYFQVVVFHNRKPIRCGKVHVQFIARKFVDQLPKHDLKTPRGYLAVSTPELTAFDLVGYPYHAGGIGNTATVLFELCDKMAPGNLREILKYIPENSQIQRLGYLLDVVLRKKKLAAPLLVVVQKRVKALIPLVPSSPRRGAAIDRTWRLFVNARVEIDI